MKNIKGIIFDLDGVLIHTDDLHFRAWKKLADKYGIYFDRTINERLRGVSRMASLEIILERADRTFSDEEKTAMADEKNTDYRALLATLTRDSVDPTVRSTLAELRRRGYLLAIGSSSKNTRFILERLELTDAFDAISDGNNISRSKPDPEVFLKAAEYLGLSPEACIVVEDAEAGIDAAVSGGFLPVGIGGAAQYKKTVHPLKSFNDLLDIAK